MCLSWGKIFRQAQLSALKIFPFCRLATAPKATFNPLSPNNRRVPSFPFHIYREKVQNSRSAFTGWENSICPSRVARLPPSLGGSGLSGANFMWESLHQHGARWPSCVRPLRSLRLVKSFVSCCVVWASVLLLSECPPRSPLRKFSSPSSARKRGPPPFGDRKPRYHLL